jgi:ATP synthase subunit 6
MHLFETKYNFSFLIENPLYHKMNQFAIFSGILLIIIATLISKTFADLTIYASFVFFYIIALNFHLFIFYTFPYQKITLITSPDYIKKCLFSPEFMKYWRFDVENLISTNFTIKYSTFLGSFLNMYSIIFCFGFIYLVIYLIYNKMLSNNTNTIIPNIFQILAELLYKISLGLFQSVLGKHIKNPELFIQVNTIFIFLLISNMQGMIPYFSTLTSALTNTFFIALALFIHLLILLINQKGIHYFLNLFLPSGCPIALSLLIIPIEMISYSFRLISLSVRLFANMMAGHTLLKVIVGFS